MVHMERKERTLQHTAIHCDTLQKFLGLLTSEKHKSKILSRIPKTFGRISANPATPAATPRPSPNKILGLIKEQDVRDKDLDLALDRRKRELNLRKRKLDLCCRAIDLRNKARELRTRDRDLRKRAADLRKRAPSPSNPPQHHVAITNALVRSLTHRIFFLSRVMISMAMSTLRAS